MNKRKRFNTISETKSNTVHLKYTSLQQQSQDLSLLLLQGLDCLTLLTLSLLILYNELFMLSFPGFPSIVLLLQVFWSKFTILFKFFSKKTNHFLTKPSTLFFSPSVTLQTHHVDSTFKRRGNGRFHVVSTWNLRSVFVGNFHLASYVFMSLQIFPLISFLISWAFFFFVFDIRLFWVSASVLRSLSSNLSVRSSRSCYLWLLVLLLTCTFHEVSKMVSKASRRYCKFFAIVCVISYIPHFQISFHIQYTFARHSSHRKNVLFLIPRHDRPKEGAKQIRLQFV